MANIREKLTLVDGFSAIYNRFIKQAKNATAGADSVSRSTDNMAVAAKSAQKAADQMGKHFDSALKNTGKLANQTSRQIQNASKEIEKAAEAAVAAQKKLMLPATVPNKSTALVPAKSTNFMPPAVIPQKGANFMPPAVIPQKGTSVVPSRSANFMPPAVIPKQSTALVPSSGAGFSPPAVVSPPEIPNTIGGGLKESIEEADDSGQELIGTLKTIAATAAAINIGQKILSLSDSISQTNARLDLMNDGLQSTAELNDMIFQAAQRARTPYQTLADSIAKMGLNAGQAFQSNQELIAFMEAVSKQFAIGGASATDMQYALIQLTQAMASGALRGEELNSILDAAPGIARAIEKSMGWASGSIKQYAQEGLVTAEVVKNAMLQSTDEINRQFKSMPMTFSQAVTMLQNQARQAFAPVGAVISETINSDAFVSGLDALGKSLYVGMTLAAQGAKVAGAAVKVVGDNLSWIIPIVGAVIAAFALYKTAMLIGAAISGAQALVNGILAAQTMLAAGATVAATAAQYGYNAALLACPITWIVIALVALIAMVFAAANSFNQMAGIANSALGVIVGTVYGAAAVIANVFAMIANLAIAAAEWIVNTFNQGVYNVQMFFYNLAVGAAEKFNSIAKGAASAAQAVANVFVKGANAAIGAINGIIDALNKIPGLNIGKMGKVGSVSVSAPQIDTSGIKAPTAPQKVSFGRFDTTTIGNAWKNGFTKGAAKGDSAMNKLTKGYDSIKNAMDSIGKYKNAAKGAGSGAGGTGGSGGSGGGKGKKGNVGSVDKVKSVGGDISLADEDVKIFRDLAERKYINNIQLKTSSPNINMSVTNNKGKDFDVGVVISKIAEVIAEDANARTSKAHG